MWIKKFFLAILASTIITGCLQAQRITPKPAPKAVFHRPVRYSQQLALRADLPFGVFQRSHFGGLGVEYAWSRKRLGAAASPKHAIGLVLQAGADFFFGRKQPTAGYGFRYDPYVYTQALVGAGWNPYLKLNLILAAGPVLGIYKNFTDAGFASDFKASYYCTTRLSIGPTVMYRHYSRADALWAAGVRAAYDF